MKKYLSLVLSIAILCTLLGSLAVTSYAAEDFTLTMRIGDPVMTVNGTEQEIDPGRGTAPVISNGRTLVPIRAIMEAMGGTVEWNGEARTVTLNYGEDMILLTIDSTTAYLNGEANNLDVAPVIILNRTMLPIRFIAESFKFDVDWTAETRTIAITKAESTTEPTTEPVAANGSRAIVVYFSRTGEQYGVGTIDKGNTAIIAEMIAEATGADVFEILPKEDHYPMTYDELTAYAQNEKSENARPEIASEIENFEDYDTVFLGYPIWWVDMPMIVYTFLEEYDFSGKTVVPFCTHAGSGLAGTDDTIKSKLSGAAVEKGLAITGTTAQNNQNSAKESVDNWLNELGYMR